MENSIINLGALFGYTLSKWRKIIMLALIFCVLFGGYGYYSTTTVSEAAESISTEEPEYDADYFDALRVYTNQATALQAEIDTLQDSVDNLTDYINESPIMKIDPQNANWCTVGAYITVADEDIIVDDLFSMYFSKILSSEFYYEISSALPDDIDASYTQDMIVTWTRASDGYIMFRIRASSVEESEIAQKIVSEHINDSFEDINNIVPHDLRVIEPIYSIETDESINAIQLQKTSDLNIATAQLAVAQAEFDALVEPVPTAPDVIEPTQLTTTQIITQAILFAVIGAIAGIAISIVCIALPPILTNKLQDGKYIKAEHNIYVFGSRPQFPRKNNPIDIFTFKLFNKTTYKNEDEFYDYIATSINVFNADKKSIHLVGTISNESLDALTQILKGKVDSPITFGGNINENSESLKSLAQSEFVIVVEQIFKTSDEKLATEIALVRDLNKEIKGAIVL